MLGIGKSNRNFSSKNNIILDQDLLFMSSGKRYAGSIWLGAGTETNKLTFDANLHSTRAFIKELHQILADISKSLFKMSFISSFITLLTHNPN